VSQPTARADPLSAKESTRSSFSSTSTSLASRSVKHKPGRIGSASPTRSERLFLECPRFRGHLDRRAIVVGHNAVESIMRELGIKGLPTRRRPRGARLAQVISLDLVRRSFRRDRPNELWMTDITEHPTREGKLYCCVVLDAFSRRVVGWAIDSTQTTLLVLNALGMATQRCQDRDGLVIHSDRGVQFTSWAFSQRVRDAGIAPSIGAVGSCFDNAMVEAFWARMQVELLNRRRWTTRTSGGGCRFRDIGGGWSAVRPCRCSWPNPEASRVLPRGEEHVGPAGRADSS
jgi:transposase InsO family protein